MSPISIPRRAALLNSAWLLATGAIWAPARAQSAESASSSPQQVRLAAAWRGAQATSDPRPGNSAAHPDQVGILALDWAARTISIVASTVVPSRAHGLLAALDGGFFAVAARPGHWLLHCDAQGREVARHAIQDDDTPRTLGGHVLASANGQWLYTTETDPRDGSGWIGVRDLRSLACVAAWPSHGLDPHHLTLDGAGALMVANGGIPRTATGAKTRLQDMDPSLVRLDASTGALLGQWRLPDRRLSLRHLAWSLPVESQQSRVLGIALQAEHDDPAHRQDAPLLALWDGQDLQLATRSIAGAGYSGDIAPGPYGGFILSGQRTHQGLMWRPDTPNTWTTIARLTEPCALASWPEQGGVLLGAARGVGLWHPTLPAAMLAWPIPMRPDNHWVLLS